MAKETVTLVMNGQVTLADFAEVIGGFVGLMNGLNDEVAKGAKIRWVVDELEAGSATTTIRGEVDSVDDEMARGDVIEAYEQVGVSLQSGRPSPFASVAPYADRMLGVINGRVTSLVFQTDDVDAEVLSAPDRSHDEPRKAAPAPRESFGTIRGRVPAMTNRHGRRFTLYELGTDRAVSCFYEPEMEEKVVAS